jgi:hypothetical protein
MECEYVSYDYLSLYKFNRVVKLLKEDYYDIDQNAKYFIIKSESEFNYCKVFETNKYVEKEDEKRNVESKPKVEEEVIQVSEANEKKLKECTQEQIRNPNTKRCVSREGKIGKKLVLESKDTVTRKYKILDIEFPVRYNDCLLNNVISHYRKLYSTFILNSETKFKDSVWDDIHDVYEKKYKDLTCYTKQYPQCLKSSRKQLYNSAQNCKEKDKKKEYIKPISSFNKKELCRFIRTHPKLRRVSDKFKKEIEEYKNLYIDKDIEEKFFQDIIKSNYKYDIRQHSGSIILFYLILKYSKDNNVFYFDLDKDSISNTKIMSHAKWNSYNETFFFPKKFIEFLKDGKSNIKIIKLSLKNEIDNHSNLLFFNVSKKEFYRYDSGGTKFYSNYNIETLEKYLEKLAKDIGYTYRYDFEFCPDLNLGSVNVLYKAKEKIQEERGFCAIHTNLLIELMILENSTDLYETQKNFIDKIIKSKYTLIYFLRKYKSYMFGSVTDFIKNYGFEGDETETKNIEEFLEDNLSYIYEDLITE